MSQTTINSTVMSAINLGSANYSNDLTVETDGAVAVSTTLTGLSVRAIYGAASLSTAQIANYGTIIASSPSVGTGAVGIELLSPGDVKNFGEIAGTNYGVLLLNGGSLYNAGTILSKNAAVDLIDSTSAYNTGLISSASIGVVENSSVFHNTGTINAENVGVYVSTNSSFENTGYITSQIAVYLAPGSYLRDSGTIAAAGSFAVFSSSAATIDLLPGAKIAGTVTDLGNDGKLEFSGSAVSSIDISSFSGFETLTFDQGSTWQLEGNAANFTTGQTIVGLGAGDSIFIKDFAATSKSFVVGTGAILSNSTASITINIQGVFTSDEIVIIGTPNGTIITAPCFVKGTHIETSSGLFPVEKLKVNDLVRCLDGAFRRIKWIGTRSYMGEMIAGNKKALPVCIKRDAFADGVPTCDLLLSPDHSVYLSGKLIAVERLINGLTITQKKHVDAVDYYHIELDRHDIILAENCPVETFLDLSCRTRFQNHASYYALYPNEPQEIVSTLERMECDADISAVQAAISQRGMLLLSVTLHGKEQGFVDEIGPEYIKGWAQDASQKDVCLTLYVLANGMPIGVVVANQYREDLEAANLGSGYHGFSFKIGKGLEEANFTVIHRRSDGGVFTLPHSTPLADQRQPPIGSCPWSSSTNPR